MFTVSFGAKVLCPRMFVKKKKQTYAFFLLHTLRISLRVEGYLPI